MGYLRNTNNNHVCRCPSYEPGPDNAYVRQSTHDQPGTVWQCDECGAVWAVSVVVGSWNAYYRLSKRKARKVLARVDSLRGEETT